MQRTAEVIRKNGLQAPYHLLQISTWLLYPLILIHYYCFLMELLWDNIIVKIIITLVFSILAVSAFYAAVVSCGIDAIDDLISQKESNLPRPPGSVYCYLCEAHVHSTSKHCKFCNKCVENFDHHCKWLNTCIGKKNYKYFLMLVSSVTLLTTLSLTLAAIYMVEFFYRPHALQERYVNASVWLSHNLVLGILCTTLALFLPLVALVYQLAGFHMMLGYYGLTTYDFIVLEQRKQRERAAERMTRQRQQRSNSFTETICCCCCSDSQSSHDDEEERGSCSSSCRHKTNNSINSSRNGDNNNSSFSSNCSKLFAHCLNSDSKRDARSPEAASPDSPTHDRAGSKGHVVVTIQNGDI